MCGENARAQNEVVSPEQKVPAVFEGAKLHLLAWRAAGVLRVRKPSQSCLNALLSCPISHPCVMVSLNSTENEVNGSGKTSK